MAIEKKVLIVDDQLGRKEDRQVEAEYCFGQVPGYDFLKETAFDGTEYSAQKVLDRVEKEKVDAVVLDLDFTDGLEEPYEGHKFGLKILESLVGKYPHIPVTMHSSHEDMSVVVECLSKGAKAYLRKKALAREMKEALDEHCK